MGTVIGLLVLALIAYVIKKNTGLQMHQWIAKKYQDHLDAKDKKDKNKN